MDWVEGNVTSLAAWLYLIVGMLSLVTKLLNNMAEIFIVAEFLYTTHTITTNYFALFCIITYYI